MRIVYEIERLSTNGGIEHILTDRVNYMAERWGWDITILVILKEDKEPYYKLSPKVKTEYLNVKTSGIVMCIEALWKLNRAVKRTNPDIYVTFQTMGALSCLLRTHKTKTIYESHIAREYFNHPLALKIAERYADCVTVLLEQQVIDFPKAKNIVAIPNFTQIISQTSPDYTNRLVVAAGRRSPQKNFERLDRLWREIQPCHTDWELKIHHDTKDMTAAYLEASVFVMTSRFEGFGMVLIEAMSCGLPCIAFDCPYGPREIIEDGKTGYLIPYDDDNMFVAKLKYLMEHPGVREQMGKAAKESVKRFSSDAIMNKWKNLYSQILSP